MEKPTLTKMTRALLSDRLRSMAQDILSWHDTGVLCDSELRAFAKEVTETLGIEPEHVLQTVEAFVLREIAFRYIHEGEGAWHVAFE